MRVSVHVESWRFVVSPYDMPNNHGNASIEWDTNVDLYPLLIAKNLNVKKYPSRCFLFWVWLSRMKIESPSLERFTGP